MNPLNSLFGSTSLFDEPKKGNSKSNFFNTNIPITVEQLHPPQIEKPIGVLVKSTSLGFKNYYQKIIEQSPKLDSGMATWGLVFSAIQNNEVDHAVWLLRNGVDASLLKDHKPKCVQEETILEVLTLLSKYPGIEENLQPKDLDKVALDLGYGYKTANLLVIKAQLKGIEGKLKSCCLSVPEFKGISHHEIKLFLKQHVPDLQKLWKEFLNTFSPLEKEKYIQAGPEDQIDIPISESGKEKLTMIQEKIVQAFTVHPFSHIALAELVDRSHPEWIIVRSTGREDSMENANAGGNDSIPFVPPDHKSISVAIGKVVGSYFGVKSIVQRLQANDKALFFQEPFMPVLLQKMICEKNAAGIGSLDKDIPCSGVLFTREQGKDPNVVTINAARGSNEGVVTSQVVTDTYQVHPEGVYSTLRIQPTRYVHIANPVKETGYHVGPILNNDSKVSHGPALSSQMVADLATLARELGKVYSDKESEIAAMDMEFTIKVEENPLANERKTVIYPLQIRPLQETKKSNPSFLDVQQLIKSDPKGDRRLVGTTLLDGGSNVRIITHPELEVIIADDITEALHKYQAHEQVKEVKAIVIRQPAPLTSHECVTLRPKGVPVIIIEDSENYIRAQSLVMESNEENPAFIDPQRAIVCRSSEGKEPKELIKLGLISYPGPLELSMKNTSLMSLSPTNLCESLLKDYLKGIDQKIDQLVSGLVKELPPIKKYSLEDLMDRMAMCEAIEAKEALAIYLRKMQVLFQELLGTDTIDKNLGFELIECMNRLVNLCCGHVRKGIEEQKPQSMGRLFPLKQLRALTDQKLNSKIIGGSSLINLHQAIHTCKKFNPLELGLPNHTLVKILMTISNEGTRKEYKEKWYKFLKDVYKKQGDKGFHDLRILLNVLGELGLKTYWFNVTFQNYTQPTLNTLQQDIQKQHKIFQTLQAYNTVLVGFQQSISSWADPEFYKKRISSFDKAFESLGFDGKAPSALAQLYAEANTLGKAAILEFFHKAMEIYDESIKALTGSGEYSSKKEQAKAFVKMLERYFELLRTATQIAEPFQAEINKLEGENAKLSQKHHHLDQFGTYLKYLKTTDFKIQRKMYNTNYYGKALDTIKNELDSLTEDACSKLFEIRDTFNVSAVSLGSHTDLTFCIFWPKTLEELFTTYHQSMEALIKTMKTKIGMDKSRLPLHIVPICEGIEIHTQQSIAKMSVLKGVLEVVYHIPFRSHASEVIIRTNLNKPEQGYQLHMTVFGNEETNRWKMTGTFAALMAELEGCSLMYGSKPKINYLNPAGTGVSFQLQMSGTFNHSAEFGLLFKDLLMKGGISYDANECSPFGLVKGVANQSGFNTVFPGLKSSQDWLKLSESFFSTTLFPNIPLLSCALNSNNYQAVKKIIRGTCYAMASYGHKDINIANVSSWGDFEKLFALGKEITTFYSQYQNELPPQLLATKYKQKYSYVKALFFALYHLSKIDSEGAQEVLSYLKSNPKTKNHFKALIEDLESVINTKVKVELHVDNHSDANLVELGQALLVLGGKPISKELMQQSRNALIALCQHPKCWETSIVGKYFEGLSDYLGMPPYNKIFYNNTVMITHKIYKAASLYLLKGLESKDFLVIDSAKESIKFVSAYLAKAKDKDVSAKHVLQFLVSIIGAYKIQNSELNINELLNDNTAQVEFYQTFWKDTFSALLKPIEQQPIAPALALRQQYCKNLEMLVEEVRVLGLIPKSALLLDKSKEALIGLSQTAKFAELSADDTYDNLFEYLGVVPYSKYLHKNQSDSTTKLYKAATFYILDGLRSGYPILSTKAIEVVQDLIVDYVNYGHKGPSAVLFKNCLFTIVAGAEAKLSPLTLFKDHPELVIEYQNFLKDPSYAQ